MCGRYGLTRPELIDAESLGVPELPPLEPRWNIAPSQDVAAVVREGGVTVATMLKWGLVPRWAEDPSIGNRMANARAESVAGKPAFRDAFRRRRCLLLADVFYEWQAPDGKRGRKQPWALRRRDARPFALAGLWERWRPREAPRDEPPLRSCTIITTQPNGVVAPIHDRMPVIVDAADYAAWLDPETPEAEALALLRPAPDELLEGWPVSLHVNDPTHDDPSVLAPA